jgi:hypothetical protein
MVRQAHHDKIVFKMGVIKSVLSVATILSQNTNSIW